MIRRTSWSRAAGVGLAALLGVATTRATAAAQTTAPNATSNGASNALTRALDFENANKLREAATAFREAYNASTDDDTRTSAILGLERSLAGLGQVDSLMPVLLPAVKARPRDPTLRQIQLRSLHTLGRDDEVRAAFDQWRIAVPNDPAPFREYARQLLDSHHPQAADTVLRLAQRQLRGSRELALEVAEMRSALGMWSDAGAAWRAALDYLPYAEPAAIFALQTAPLVARDTLRLALLAPPATLSARRTASALFLAWRQPNDAWQALAGLAPSDSTFASWRDFAERAEQIDAWTAARAAWTRLADGQKSSAVALRAAAAALKANDGAGAIALLDRAGDSARTREGVLLRVEALARAGRPGDAAKLAADAGAKLDASDRTHAAAVIADAWVRAGDVAQARSALAAAGESGDASAGGWLALYAGDLKQARALLRRTSDAPGTDPGLAIVALALLARTRADSAPAVGQAFMSAARGDTAAAAAQFETAAKTLPEAGSLLLATAGRLRAARRDTTAAVAIWQSIVANFAESPEAPEAELSWARALLARGNKAEASAHLEHLIITYPRSALVPIARRELEQLKP